MQSLLSQLNSVPGVVGSMVYDSEGRLLAQMFPPVFEPPMLRSAASVLADSMAGLETVTGPLGVVDLRYGDARIVVKPLARAQLLLLCAPSMNLHLLAIATSVAASKLEKLVPARPPPQAAARAVGGELHQAVQRIESAIERRKLDRFRVRGEIAIQAGFALGCIDADTPDDPAMLASLKAAASAVLGESI